LTAAITSVVLRPERRLTCGVLASQLRKPDGHKDISAACVQVFVGVFYCPMAMDS
jgi:hypothetical protein